MRDRTQRSTRHAFRYQGRIARNVEQSSSCVVVVTDEVESFLVRTGDAIVTQRESLGVDADQLAERRERGSAEPCSVDRLNSKLRNGSKQTRHFSQFRSGAATYNRRTA